MTSSLPEGWIKTAIRGLPIWRHVSGAQVYQSSFWRDEEEKRLRGEPKGFWTDRYDPSEEIATWKAQRVRDVPYGDDDGFIYLKMEEAMTAALDNSKRKY